MSDTEHLVRAIKLFNAALEKPLAERRAWLQAQSLQDNKLWLLVQQMLFANLQT